MVSRTSDIKKFQEFENKEFCVEFDRNKDFLRIIQANFNYDSKNLKYLFNFENIEKQLIDRFLRMKPEIDLKVTLKKTLNFKNFSLLLNVIRS